MIEKVDVVYKFFLLIQQFVYKFVLFADTTFYSLAKKSNGNISCRQVSISLNKAVCFIINVLSGISILRDQDCIFTNQHQLFSIYTNK